MTLDQKVRAIEKKAESAKASNLFCGQSQEFKERRTKKLQKSRDSFPVLFVDMRNAPKPTVQSSTGIPVVGR
jgi:hypothetical protein